MHRRKAFQNIALLIGGAILLPKGIKASNSNQLEINHLSITEADQKLLSEICETILPKTDTPGSKGLGLHLFVLKMVDDCYSEKDQIAFMAGLEQINELSKTQFASAFEQLSIDQRESLLSSIEKKDNTYSKEVNTFYRITKDKTVQGYKQSKFFMTKVVVYELAPGRYNPHFSIAGKH